MTVYVCVPNEIYWNSRVITFCNPLKVCLPFACGTLKRSVKAAEAIYLAVKQCSHSYIRIHNISSVCVLKFVALYAWHHNRRSSNISLHTSQRNFDSVSLGADFFNTFFFRITLQLCFLRKWHTLCHILLQAFFDYLKANCGLCILGLRGKSKVKK